MAVQKELGVPCAGVNHADFSRDGAYFIVSCEFSGQLLKVDTRNRTLLGVVDLPQRGAMPQDVVLVHGRSPDKTRSLCEVFNAPGLHARPPRPTKRPQPTWSVPIGGGRQDREHRGTAPWHGPCGSTVRRACTVGGLSSVADHGTFLCGTVS